MSLSILEEAQQEIMVWLNGANHVTSSSLYRTMSNLGYSSGIVRDALVELVENGYVMHNDRGYSLATQDSGPNDGNGDDGMKNVYQLNGDEAPAIYYMATDGSLYRIDNGNVIGSKRERAILESLLRFSLKTITDENAKGE